jgi:hypothetical protein
VGGLGDEQDPSENDFLQLSCNNEREQPKAIACAKADEHNLGTEIP